MAIFPGPKNIIWITQGVPLSFRTQAQQTIEFTPIIRQIGSDFRRANIAVDPVRTVLNVQVNERATLDLFADMTGGKGYMANEIESAIGQVTQPTRASYRIGFYPGARNWDGKFHKIKVNCARNGVRLQAAQGYTADLAKELPLRDENGTIGWAQSSPRDIPDIALRAIAKPVSGSESMLQVHVDVSDLVLQQDQDHYRGQLVAVVNRYFKDGRPPEIEKLSGDIDLTAKQLETAKAEGIALSPGTTMNATIAAIRFIVMDRATGAVGTLTISK
jgi:hypothetical protein